MGAKVQVGNGFVEAYVEGELKGAKIYLDFPSVGDRKHYVCSYISKRDNNP